MSYYTYRHHQGYGQHDYLADEVIARAARRLGLDTGTRIAQACGLVSHPVPMGHLSVRMPYAPETRRKMEQALAAARREILPDDRSVDCRIDVVCCRVRFVGPDQTDGRHYYPRRTRLVEQRQRSGWVVVDASVVD